MAAGSSTSAAALDTTVLVAQISTASSAETSAGRRYASKTPYYRGDQSTLVFLISSNVKLTNHPAQDNPPAMAIRHYHPTDLHLPEPNPLYLRYQQIQAESACAPHSHPGASSASSVWGDGDSAGRSPAGGATDYLIWVPAIWNTPPTTSRPSTTPPSTSITPWRRGCRLRAQAAADDPVDPRHPGRFCDRKLGHMADEWTCVRPSCWWRS